MTENPPSITIEPSLDAVEQDAGTPVDASVMSEQVVESPQTISKDVQSVGGESLLLPQPQTDAPENLTTEPESQKMVEVMAEPPVTTTEEIQPSQLTTDADSSLGYPPQADPRGKRPRKKARSRTKKTKAESKPDSMKTILLYLYKEGYPGRDKLAEVLGISTKTIDRYLEEMETLGMIEKTGRSSFTLSERASKAAEESEKRKKLQA